MTKKQPTSSTKQNVERLGDEIKLGIDVHAASYTVVMKVDSSAPLRARKISPEKFLSWVRELRERCDRLYTCYEAGCFGYSLHRNLTALGITNFVIRPINWDAHGKNVKTDNRDALQMSLSLDSYLRGNDRSFSIVRVPTEQEERNRSVTRLRQTLIKERGRAAKRGLSTARYYGVSLQGSWWRPTKWKQLQQELESYLLELLEPFRQNCVHFENQIKEQEAKMEEQQPEVALPRGMGMVLFEQMEREICDWNRFKNRKAVSSYTGLCPSEDSSSKRRFQGSINKHGNPRLRRMLVECVWLLMAWNSDYSGIVKWKEKLYEAEHNKSTKKRIVVAIARQFAVDWWRIRTGQIQPSAVGLEMKPVAVSMDTYRVPENKKAS